MSTGIIRVGLSAWTCETWRGSFYPRDLRRERELGYAATQFRLLELNATFHGLQHPESFRGWAEQVPAEFVFCVRGPRLITHVLRLQEAEVALANFIASGLLRLGLHLGPVLWQLPANLRFEPKRMEAFLRLLPRTTDAALILGRKHDHQLRGPAWLTVDALRPVRHAIQVRHPSFCCPDFVDLLRAYEIGLVCNDPGDSLARADSGDSLARADSGDPFWADVTADFVYCRLRDASDDASLGPDNAALTAWANRFRVWAAGGEPGDAHRIGGKARPRRRDVFAVFDTGRNIRGPTLAQEMIRRLRA
jgi:uncharacterized protein YecE (DUF72 family)